MSGFRRIRRQGDESSTEIPVSSTSTPVETFTSTISQSPPESSEVNDSGSGIPKIAGSEGGFIGLIVGLGVIFIASCIGVFLLLRYRPHGGRTTHEKSGEVGKVSTSPRRRGTLFGFKSKNPRKGGWVPAPNTADDDWDDGFDRIRGERLGTVVDASNDTSTQPAQSNAFGLDGSGEGSLHVHSLSQGSYRAVEENNKGDMSASSIELVAARRGREMDHLYSNPFDDTALVRSSSPVRYDDSIRSRSPSPHIRQPIVPSGSTMSATSLTFPSGTKFRESL